MHASTDTGHSELIHDLDAVVWEADPVTFQFSYVSLGAERLFGYSLEQWLARPAFWVDLLHPEDREQAVATCQTAVQECRDHEFEYRAITADGRVLWIRDLVRVICDANRRVTALHGVMIDITEQRRATSALERKDQYYRALIEQVLDIIAVVNRDGTLQYESPSGERTLGYPLADRLGRNVFDLVHPDDLPRVRAVFEASISTGRPTTRMRFRYRHADGTWRILEAIGRPFVDADGQLVGIVNSRDVTDRQQLDEPFRDQPKGPLEIVNLDQSLLDLKGVLKRIVGPGVRIELTLGAHTARVRLAKGALEQIIKDLATNARDTVPQDGTIRISTTDNAERVVIEVAAGQGTPLRIQLPVVTGD